jgi:hypothetical protein
VSVTPEAPLSIFFVEGTSNGKSDWVAEGEDKSVVFGAVSNDRPPVRNREAILEEPSPAFGWNFSGEVRR